MRQFAYVPAMLEVAVGDTVRWFNRDPVPHTATGENAEWDSGRIEKDGSWSYVATEPGTMEYICSYHPTMKAVLRVTSR